MLYSELQRSDGPAVTREAQLRYRSNKALGNVMDRYGTQKVTSCFRSNVRNPCLVLPLLV